VFAVLAVVAVAVVMVAACVPTRPSGVPPSPTLGHAGHAGRWLTDARGRVLMLHGVNLVAKTDGETPAAMGFGADDAAWLKRNGFDVVRLGLTAGSVMPRPGVIDDAYLDSFFRTVDELTAQGLYVLVDLHQDGWGPTLGSDGFPGWMTITNGAPNTGTPFPLYYVTNPAIQAAFDNLWANTPGPGGVGLQDRVATMFGALASRVRTRPMVLGYDLLNEPWPGTVWQPCLTPPSGCPAQDVKLDGYYARVTRAIRAQDRSHLVFGEPYVLFNFGDAGTNVTRPGGDRASGLSNHLYATDVTKEPAVQSFALQWSTRTGGAVLNTEFGATTDTVAIDRQVDELDGALVPWIWWAYNEDVVRDPSKPPAESNLVTNVVDALVRPHPTAVAGTPESLVYDTATRTMHFTYSTARAGGAHVPPGLPGVTELDAPARVYPAGYRVSVTGGVVVSRPGAPDVRVVSLPHATEVMVTMSPAA
jgi:endoglycosylceramidase